MNYGMISDCYNKGNVYSYGPTSRDNNEMYAGGITGGNYKYVQNCYNTGKVTGKAWGTYTGGISGGGDGTLGGYVKNCYNIGEVNSTGSYNRIGGVVRKKWMEWYILCISNYKQLLWSRK